MQADWDLDMVDDDDAYEGPDGFDEEDIEVDLDTEDLVEEAAELEAERNETLETILGAFGRSENANNTGPVNTGTRPATTAITGINIRDLVRILGIGSGGFGRGRPDDDDEDEEDDDDTTGYPPFSTASQSWMPEVKEPQKEGVELLMSGDFGRVQNKILSRSKGLNVAKQLASRSMSVRRPYREDIAADLIPNTNGTAVATYEHNAYSGQFSTDSSFYYTCVQDFSLHVYDMTAARTPFEPKKGPQTIRGFGRRYRGLQEPHETTMKVLNTIQGHPGRWTITDSHLSPDNERMIYASISPVVYMTSVHEPSPNQVPLRFSDPPRRTTQMWGLDEDRFGIWSCRFSADGNEVVAGGDGYIFVYDLLANRRSVKITAHEDDVNSCCWADTASGNVLISASDDSFIKVWDRRSLGSSQRPSGVLVGHTEGITNVSAKGDGRYIISNGKDQALRLWDLRKMLSSGKVDTGNYGIHNYDYRYGRYPRPRYMAHPQDCSVMTYRGHAVLKTLIRCHFSPAETTGGQYVYSGSADGRIHIWSLDGRVLQVLDRQHTLPLTFDPSAAEYSPGSGRGEVVCVRDVSWHSKEPVLMSVGWNDGRGSVVARHEWKGLSKMGGSLEDWTEKAKAERAERARRRANRLVPGAFDLGHNHDTAPRQCCKGAHCLSSFPSPMNMMILNEKAPDAHGFPPGYFIIRSVGSDRLLDVDQSGVEDGTELILYVDKEKLLVDYLRRPESDNQVFFIDDTGAFCSRSSGHAIDVEDERLVLRHRRPVTEPYPNPISHPLPKFSYSETTGEITVTFETDPAYPPPGQESTAWTKKRYVLSSIPLRRPRSLMDNASNFLSNAIATPLSFLGSPTRPKATPEDVFDADIDLNEHEIVEQDRGEEGEVDDSPNGTRRVRVLAVDKGDDAELGDKARQRRRWQIVPLRTTAAPRRGSGA
ncbi:hypothetical protein JAAARDRAFT_147176 [Jaapia argillacea MUCL 33604]|uniref:Uncharacterized protein n=1 Tax=Jaapia argillacea MUCL 33604 TaxID=933084 RepID=A0A067Q7Y5_9AGAM|nr:hypothetical protein JAAARDRAFT_147176 [Jaapia argillacea MUCL 33604]